MGNNTADNDSTGIRFSRRLKRTWVYRRAGAAQPLKYLEKANPESRRNMLALLEHVDEYGYHTSETRYRVIKGPIVELKVKTPKPIRMLAYRLPQGGHVLLLGFDKSDGPIPKATMRRAAEMAKEFEKGGMQLDE